MLSKKEYKYRYKIIYENHLNKDMQKYLDEYIKSKSLTYKYVYVNSINIRIQYTLNKMNDAMKMVASSFENATNSVKAFNASIENYAKSIENYAKQQARGYYYD